MKKQRFILASASPRRRELFESAGYEFEIIPCNEEESAQESLSAEETVKALAMQKAMCVSKQNKGAVVLGCDTVVATENEILGKPQTQEQAAEMLKLLSGKTHFVYSGVCITDGERTESFASKTEVEFYDLSEKTILSYVNSKEPMDKAGAYGIQGLGSALVKGIKGDYYTVVGLPLGKCERVLASFGVFGRIRF